MIAAAGCFQGQMGPTWLYDLIAKGLERPFVC